MHSLMLMLASIRKVVDVVDFPKHVRGLQRQPSVDEPRLPIESKLDVVYVSGRLTTGCFVSGTFDAWVWEQNVRRAEEMALELTLVGFAVICVHTTARYMFGRVPEALALAADFELLRRCDAIAMCEGWEESSGAKQELEIALRCGVASFGHTTQIIGSSRIDHVVSDMVRWREARAAAPAVELVSP